MTRLSFQGATSIVRSSGTPPLAPSRSPNSLPTTDDDMYGSLAAFDIAAPYQIANFHLP